MALSLLISVQIKDYFAKLSSWSSSSSSFYDRFLIGSLIFLHSLSELLLFHLYTLSFQVIPNRTRPTSSWNLKLPLGPYYLTFYWHALIILTLNIFPNLSEYPYDLCYFAIVHLQQNKKRANWWLKFLHNYWNLYKRQRVKK